MTLGQNIQNARRAQGLSQEALAEKIGVSRQALGKWEKDTALPGLDNLQALAAAVLAAGVFWQRILTFVKGIFKK